MKKLVIVYWSGTGNTEIMAKGIAEGAKEGGLQVELLTVDNAKLSDVLDADVVALGCPSMGAEVLEEIEMEPFVEGLEGNIQDKSMVLFGSYGWGDGEWMVDWETRMKGYGASFVADSLIINEMPDAIGIKKCVDLGKSLK